MELATKREFEMQFFDLILTRSPDGKAVANVPHEIVRHSPAGFDWGYEGSGPAELALNALSAMVGRRKAEKNGLYQRFKSEFIAGLPFHGGIIPAKSTMNWYFKNEPKRDYSKQAAWERMSYDQIKFRMKKDVSASFKAHLAKHGITAADWFKHAVSLDLVPPKTGQAVPAAQAAVVRRKRAPSPSAETVEQWRKMHSEGMSFGEIAASTGLYDESSVRKRVKGR